MHTHAAIPLLLLALFTGPLRAQVPGTVIITEFMADPTAVNDAVGEWIELYNISGTDVDIAGWKLMDPVSSVTIGGGASFIVPALSHVIFCRNLDPGVNGGLTGAHLFNFNLNNAGGDVITLTDPADVVMATVAYPYAIPGRSWQLDAAHYGDGQDFAYWCLGTEPYNASDQGTPGLMNGNCGPTRLEDGAPGMSVLVVADDLLRVTLAAPFGVARKWSILDACGRTSITGAIPRGEASLSIPIAGLAAGGYLFAADGGPVVRFVVLR